MDPQHRNKILNTISDHSKASQVPAFTVKPANKSRLGVISVVYHQQPDANPTVVESRYSRWLDSDEQPYLRKLTLGEDWQELDCGWLKETGMLVIKNEEGRFQVQPTDAERALVMSKVIEIGIVPPSPLQLYNPSEQLGEEMLVVPISKPIACWQIPPLESMQAMPVNLPLLRLRCRNGRARCSVNLIPL